eukprot:6456023-Amphidinium_carterae.1
MEYTTSSCPSHNAFPMWWSGAVGWFWSLTSGLIMMCTLPLEMTPAPTTPFQFLVVKSGRNRTGITVFPTEKESSKFVHFLLVHSSVWRSGGVGLLGNRQYHHASSLHDAVWKCTPSCPLPSGQHLVHPIPQPSDDHTNQLTTKTESKGPRAREGGE